MISKIMIEKFNEKYADLLPEQRSVLKTYINNITNTVSLREFINQELDNIKNSLTSLQSFVQDKRTQIKLTELISIIKPLDKTESAKDEDILNILQFHELIHEIKSI
jgi:glucan phosphorylase